MLLILARVDQIFFSNVARKTKKGCPPLLKGVALVG